MSEDKKAKARAIRDSMSVTTLTCERTVVGPDGSTTSVRMTAQPDESWTKVEARVAAMMLALEVDVAAIEHAVANGSYPREVGAEDVEAVRRSYAMLISREVTSL